MSPVLYCNRQMLAVSYNGLKPLCREEGTSAGLSRGTVFLVGTCTLAARGVSIHCLASVTFERRRDALAPV